MEAEGAEKAVSSPEFSLTGWTAFWQRTMEDWLSVPFFCLWAIPLCLAIQYSSDEKVNDFFVNTHGEGIAIKSMGMLLAASLFPAGLALVLHPNPNGNWVRLLRSPARAGRSMSMTTFAFMLGAAFVLGIAEGSSRMYSLMTFPLAGCVLIWAMLFALDSFILQAKSWSTMELNGLATALGWSLVVTGVVAPMYLYCQIIHGVFFPAAS